VDEQCCAADCLAGLQCCSGKAAAHSHFRVAGLDYSLTPTQPPPVDDSLARLSVREKILFLIAEGMGNQEIGRQLYLAKKTIKHYVTGN